MGCFGVLEVGIPAEPGAVGVMFCANDACPA